MQLDRRGGELWAERRVGVGRLRLSLARGADNVDQDPRTDTTTTSRGGVSLELARPRGPTLTLAYARGLTETEHGPATSHAPGGPSTTAAVETVSASLGYHGRRRWDASLSSAVSRRQEPATDRETTSVSCDLRGTYRPTASVTLAPAVEFRDERYRWVGEGMRTTSASLALGYSAPSQVVGVWASGSHARTVSSDGYADTNAVNATSTLAWQIHRASEARSVALEVRYSRYLDAVYPDSSYDDLSVLVLFRIAPSSAGRAAARP
jgi:hypothetical protein